jgi:hypothetical protein
VKEGRHEGGFVRRRTIDHFEAMIAEAQQKSAPAMPGGMSGF